MTMRELQTERKVEGADWGCFAGGNETEENGPESHAQRGNG
jgi:hypothetical protein